MKLLRLGKIGEEIRLGSTVRETGIGLLMRLVFRREGNWGGRGSRMEYGLRIHDGSRGSRWLYKLYVKESDLAALWMKLSIRK